MASRTSTSVAMGISLTIFILLSVALFVLTMVFFSQKKRAEGDIRTLQAEYESVVEAPELNSDRVRGIVSESSRSNKSAMSHLIAQHRELLQLAVGTPDVSVEAAKERIAQTADLSGGSMLEFIRRQNQKLQAAQSDAANARAAAERAQADANNTIARIQEGQTKVDDIVTENRGRLNDYVSRVERMRQNTDTYMSDTERKVDELRSEMQDRISDRDSRIAELQEQILILQGGKRGADSGAGLRPVNEATLVDGKVVAIDAVDGTAIISLGRSDKVTVGLTFSVYSDASALQASEGGEYSPGKAVLEVIRVEETGARCRVLSERRGNPVVKGDVIANPVYDPSKTYKFVVYGDFDTNRDGRATHMETARLKALIEEWGGEVVDDIQGDLDFLVLGAAPSLPPAPGGSAPRAVVEEYVRLTKLVERYDDLFSQASDASIPVLNENRLYTLIGEVPN